MRKRWKFETPPFSHNQVLHKNGVSLVGAINFFSEHIATVAFKSIEDSLHTWEEYSLACTQLAANETEVCCKHLVF
jgi:hypothetical protein